MNLFGFILTTRDLWLLGIAGALSIVLINYRLANTRDRIARLAAASTKFNSNILNILSGLYPLASNWPKNINDLDAVLRSAFPKMQIAIEEFNPFLPWYKQIFFKRAWSRFRNAYSREQDIQCYHHYMPFISTSIVNGKEVTEDNTASYKENFKHNVDKLLSYCLTNKNLMFLWPQLTF
jgi:hypothetical protein